MDDPRDNNPTQIFQKGQAQGTQGDTASDDDDASLEAETVIEEAPDDSAKLQRNIYC